MRVDKYLWCIRAFKTRSLATQYVKAGKVWVNDEEVKPARDVKVGHVIKVRKGAVYFEYKVLDLPKNRLGAKLVPDYMKDITAPTEMEKYKQIQEANRDMRKYQQGRPTKKDRRDLDNLFG